MALAKTNLIKLLLLIPHLGGGGAERVTSLLAQHLDPNRFEIHLGLITQDAPGAARLPSWVVVHRLNAVRVRSAVFKLFELIWKVHPDVVLSSMAHLNFLILLLQPFLRRKTRILVRQNTTASFVSNWLTGLLYRGLYPTANGIICQSEAMASDLQSKFAAPRRKLVVLANPLATAADWEAGCWVRSGNSVSILCVARLSSEKGVDLLLRAFAMIKQGFPAISLTVLGTGSEEQALLDMAEDLGLDSRGVFRGFADPLPFYSEATVFVCPSRYEGMPNALLEAAAAGLPIVATPSSLGVTGLLRGAPGTWMSQEISAPALAAKLVEALQHLLALPAAERRFRHAFLAPFETGRAIHAYERVLLRVQATGHL